MSARVEDSQDGKNLLVTYILMCFKLDDTVFFTELCQPVHNLKKQAAESETYTAGGSCGSCEEF